MAKKFRGWAYKIEQQYQELSGWTDFTINSLFKPVTGLRLQILRDNLKSLKREACHKWNFCTNNLPDSCRPSLCLA